MEHTTLIYFPLVIMLILVGVSVTGLGSAAANAGLNSTFALYQTATGTGVDAFGNAMTLNDQDGNPVCYYNQTSVYGEAGLIIAADTNGYPPQEAAWQNATTWYNLYYDEDGADPVFYYDLQNGVVSRPEGRVGPQWQGLQTFNLTDSWAWLALVAAIAVIISIVGFKIAASGESETSVQTLLKSTFFITVWVTLSLVAYPLILLGGFMVILLYFGLTLTYASGIILSVGGG